MPAPFQGDLAEVVEGEGRRPVDAHRAAARQPIRAVVADAAATLRKDSPRILASDCKTLAEQKANLICHLVVQVDVFARLVQIRFIERTTVLNTSAEAATPTRK